MDAGCLCSRSSSTVKFIAIFCLLSDIVLSAIEKLNHRIPLPQIHFYCSISSETGAVPDRGRNDILTSFKNDFAAFGPLFSKLIGFHPQTTASSNDRGKEFQAGTIAK